MSTQLTPTIMSNSQKFYECKSHDARSRRTEEDHQEANPNIERGRNTRTPDIAMVEHSHLTNTL